MSRIQLHDPGLRVRKGHHFDFLLQVLPELHASVQLEGVYAHRDFDPALSEALPGRPPVRRVYELWPYDRHLYSPGEEGDRAFLRAQVMDVTRALKSLTAAYASIWPTLTAAQLAAAASVAGTAKITGIIHYPIRSGLEHQLWLDALETARAASLEIRILASNPELARHMASLLGTPVHPAPMLAPSPPRPRLRSHPATVAILGSGRPEQGAGRALELVSQLTAGGWRVILQCAETPGDAPIEPSPGVLRLSYVEDLTTLLEDVDLVVLPYVPAAYRMRASGMAWNALAAGVPLVTPAGTSVATLVQEFRAGVVATSDANGDLLAAVAMAEVQWQSIALAAHEAALGWEAHAGARRLAAALLPDAQLPP